jgi:hypothetical protein
MDADLAVKDMPHSFPFFLSAVIFLIFDVKVIAFAFTYSHYNIIMQLTVMRDTKISISTYFNHWIIPQMESRVIGMS